MTSVCSTNPEQLTEAELDFLCLLTAQGRQRLQRIARNSQPAAADDGQGFPSVPATPAARAAMLEQARNSGRPAGDPRRRRQPGSPARFRDQLQRGELRVLWHEQLPLALRQVPDPPWALYLRGNPDALHAAAVAIVGARTATARGCRWTRQLARELSTAGLTIVSGLALGIDAAGHQGCLDARAAPTIAVLGSGADQPTPRQHARLASAIVAGGGALLSEYAPGQGARAHHFPERNRLVSGLALGLVVVEATERSGSLITARLALEQGRELMAVPGPVGLPNSAGCHRLLRQGATLVTGAAEVLEAIGRGELAPARVRAAEPPDLEHRFAATDVQLAQQLYLACDAVAQPMAVLVEIVQGDPARVAHVLTLLELHGLIQRSGVGYVRR